MFKSLGFLFIYIFRFLENLRFHPQLLSDFLVCVQTDSRALGESQRSLQLAFVKGDARPLTRLRGFGLDQGGGAGEGGSGSGERAAGASPRMQGGEATRGACFIRTAPSALQRLSLRLSLRCPDFSSRCLVSNTRRQVPAETPRGAGRTERPGVPRGRFRARPGLEAGSRLRTRPAPLLLRRWIRTEELCPQTRWRKYQKMATFRPVKVAVCRLSSDQQKPHIRKKTRPQDSLTGLLASSLGRASRFLGSQLEDSQAGAQSHVNRLNHSLHGLRTRRMTLSRPGQGPDH